MKLTEAPAATVRVGCPHCAETFNLPLITTAHDVKTGNGFIRVRPDHTEIDGHISSVHGVALA